MGECYYHGGETYPGHPCEECQIAERISLIGSDEAWRQIKSYGLRMQMDLQKDRKDALAIQQGKIDFRKAGKEELKCYMK